MRRIKNYPILHIWLLAGILCLGGCKKYLEEKPDQQLSEVKSVADLQALLDNHLRLSSSDPASPEISADDIYVIDDIFNAVSLGERNTYSWAERDLFREGPSNEWATTYANIYKANVVLQEAERIERIEGDESGWNAAKGHALLLRAKCFAQAANIWCKAYDATTASTDLGLPLRLDPDFNKPSVRSTVAEAYDRILADAKEAARLLPVRAIQVLRPSRPAAYALLARTYLSMRVYDSAARYAALSLADKDDLQDYNQVDANSGQPFAPRFSNPEILWDLAMIGPPDILYPDYCYIDTLLYKSYADDDLRKTCFFRINFDNSISFKGSYEGGFTLFDGMATDEAWLIRAECYARAGNTVKAMEDLNYLLMHRYKAGLFSPLVAADANEALDMILKERRKELLQRGLRWADLKRLNREGRDITIRRFNNNAFITLLPNSNRYVLPIPEDVIRMTGMEQNPR